MLFCLSSGKRKVFFCCANDAFNVCCTESYILIFSNIGFVAGRLPLTKIRGNFKTADVVRRLCSNLKQ